PPSQPTPASPSPSQTLTRQNNRQIAERIATLLAHYWTPNDSPELRKLVAADWMSDLKEFPADVVSAACQDWRRSEARRPTPADIRKRCWEVMPKPAAKVESDPAPPTIPPDDVVRSNWKIIADEWGFRGLTAAETKLEEQRRAQFVEQTYKKHGFLRVIGGDDGAAA